MKTWSLSPILLSAYLSAMLTSGIAPIRPQVIFAAAVDPMAAQKAMQTAVSSISGDGWVVPSFEPAATFEPQATASIQQPKADPTMNAELMARLIKLAEAQEEAGSIPATVCGIFNLCDGTAALPVKMLETDAPKGLYFAMPWAAGSKDIVILKKTGAEYECYLTDKTFKLRAAAISDATGTRLIPNGEAAAKFKAELNHFAREASDLPPTGAAVAAGS